MVTRQPPNSTPLASFFGRPAIFAAVRGIGEPKRMVIQLVYGFPVMDYTKAILRQSDLPCTIRVILETGFVCMGDTR